MEEKTLREVKLLKVYSAFLTILVISLFLMSFISNPGKESFKEIDVERINIVESNGDLKMVISNQERQHPGMLDGKVIRKRERPAGIIFFNEEQDEVGGLVYHGNSEEGAGMVLSIDQYKNDQIMQLQYAESEKGNRKYGLQLWDRDEDLTLPFLLSTMDSLQHLDYSRNKIFQKLREMNEGEPIFARRLFVGKNINQQVGLFIQDENGKNRIKIYVDKQNKAQMELLDEDGNTIPLDSLK